MNSTLRIPLNTSPEQAERLMLLQRSFAQVCNVLAQQVQHTRIWNRVALHHMAYRPLREAFPQMGSQMVCNAIYSVSRTARLVFQHPASPFHLSRLQGQALPLLQFTDSAPVYFDRHTLSLKGGHLSMFTLDGRMRFQLTLGEHDEQLFHTGKLREIVLSRRAHGGFELSFWLQSPQGDAPHEAQTETSTEAPTDTDTSVSAVGEIPEYVMVHVLSQAQAAAPVQAQNLEPL